MMSSGLTEASRLDLVWISLSRDPLARSALAELEFQLGVVYVRISFQRPSGVFALRRSCLDPATIVVAPAGVSVGGGAPFIRRRETCQSDSSTGPTVGSVPGLPLLGGTAFSAAG
jgi:hypothetical protein